MIRVLIPLLVHTHPSTVQTRLYANAKTQGSLPSVVYLADAAALKRVTHRVMFLQYRPFKCPGYGTCQGNEHTSRKVFFFFFF